MKLKSFENMRAGAAELARPSLFPLPRRCSCTGIEVTPTLSAVKYCRLHTLENTVTNLKAGTLFTARKTLKKESTRGSFFF